MQPLVSIIIPTYNRADLIGHTIESILNQTYKNIEIIVVDDGSTDNTKAVLERYAGKIKYIYKDNGGTCSARNVGLKAARGEFLGFIDSDDEYLPEKIELCVKYLLQNKDMAFVHTAAYFIDENGSIVGKYSHPKSRHVGQIADRLVLCNFICNPTVFSRRECLDKVGNFDESMFQPADWDMWLRLAEQFKAGYINSFLAKYRISSYTVYKNLEKSRREEMVVLNKFFERNKGNNSFLKRAAFSSLHLRYAQCYFLQDNFPELKAEFIAALKYNPLNFKAAVLFLAFLLARPQLRAILTKRILRTGIKPINYSSNIAP